MKDARVELINKQGIVLNPKVFSSGNKRAIIFIPGLAQDFEGFIENLASMAEDYNYDFIFSDTQNNMVKKLFKQVYKNQEIHDVLRGACFDRIRNAHFDIDCTLNYFSELYDEIAIVAHCYGCDKIINYLSKTNIKNISSLSLLAPQDVYSIIEDSNEDYINLRQAIKNVKDKQPCKLLRKKLFSFCEVSSGTYLDMMSYPKYYSFPIFSYLSKNNQLKDLNLPIQLIIGEKDRGISHGNIEYSADEYLYRASKFIKAKELSVVDNCSHSFKQNKNELAKVVLSFIERNSKEKGVILK